MLHHVAVALLASPGVDHLVHEGDLLDGVDGVEVVLDPDAMLPELRGDALPSINGEVAGTVWGLLQHSSVLLTRLLLISLSHLSHTFRSVPPPDEAG